ncbi:hypothetical protein [Rhizobium sp. GN54]|uniref:hypothetical protein n=1 Tax=Rhizobium sp. GN54 TaxID=2898150 RepID=UPI001E5450B1|nr:hypothetical protein [Rhizobium sp. GN54]MCD2183308.1 hypothetical protein [Rhizobium sp. GN54]
MTNLTRRQSLGLLAAVSVPPATVVAVASAQPAEKPFDLQHWLDTADLNAVINYHAARLAEAMNERDPLHWYRTDISYEYRYVLVVGHPVNQEASR